MEEGDADWNAEGKYTGATSLCVVLTCLVKSAIDLLEADLSTSYLRASYSKQPILAKLVLTVLCFKYTLSFLSSSS